jgi:Na+/H+ antiporter NhaD/arsenite permease-like protein
MRQGGHFTRRQTSLSVRPRFSIFLLGGLFVISCGVFLEGDLQATPRTNTAILAVGALLASFVAHTVVFFIFIVANVGGCLTPLGDPPLFLGYSQGVPFTWTFRLFVPWLFTVLALLLVYRVWDGRAYAGEARADLRCDFYEVRPLRLASRENLLMLAGVLVAVAVLRAPWREAAIVALAALSFARTDPARRRANRFTFRPILEVTALFVGIFVTMLPALDVLRARGAELGAREPWQFFWTTGIHSSFLDNAPTYLTFLALGQGVGLPADVVGVPHEILVGISLGTVFMGANTYIGNGPNFMVRAIAEERGVKMPGFFGYMLYSAAVLLPLFALVTLVFFRG